MSERKQQFISSLFKEQASSLVKYLSARFRDGAEAEEVAQEAWLRLYGLDSPESLTNAKAFLFQTASNLSIDRIRRRKLEQRHQVPSDEVARSVEDTLAAKQIVELLETALLELPIKVRQAFVLHRHSGLSYAQIADQLGVSTSMVEKYIIQTLKHFRNKLEQNNTEV
ncbi:MAG: RNA polymerase sigma factor (sigma-70 family) [Limisphaerales bacterium]|jgi:RNA polymerase sigma factor (sigma-70 family)